MTAHSAYWFPKRGELYWVDLDKIRPALVVSNNSLNRAANEVMVVPFSTAVRLGLATRVLFASGEAGLMESSWAVCDQIATAAKHAFDPELIGVAPASRLAEVEAAIRKALAL